MGITITNSGQGSMVRFRNLGRGGVMTSTKNPPFLLLNYYPGAAAAYSLRKLDYTYTGPAIRVRRSSDNTEQNIGFINNNLDAASLLAFCGASNGFVTTWYDQSGNARDLIQTTTANQPNIVTSGVIQSVNGKPVVYFNNTTQSMSVAYAFSGDNSFIFDVFKTSDTSFVLYYGTDGLGYYMTVGTYADTTNPLNGSSTLYQIYRNAVLQTPVTRTDVYNLLSLNDQILVTQKVSLVIWPKFTIGGYSGLSFEHYKSELLIYNTDQSATRAEIETNINSYYSTYSPVVGSNLLDQYPYAAGAYSVRKLRTSYTGSAIRVRRSSDNVESDIGFVNNELDTATLTTFIGANSGFVTTWYDQSFYGRNLVETTAANQPIIVNAGTLQTVNGKPAVYFDTTAKKLNVAYGFPGANSLIFDVLKSNDNIFIMYHNVGGAFVSVGNSVDSSTLINGGATVSQYYRNGALQTSPTTRIGVYNLVSTNTQILLTHKLELSGWGNFTLSGYSGFEFVHYKQELVIYNRDASTERAGITSNINSYYTIY